MVQGSARPPSRRPPRAGRTGQRWVAGRPTVVGSLPDVSTALSTARSDHDCPEGAQSSPRRRCRGGSQRASVSAPGRQSCTEATGSKPAARKARSARALPGAQAATTTSPSRHERQRVAHDVGARVVLGRVGLEAQLGQPAQPRREGHERVVVGGGIPERRDARCARRSRARRGGGCAGRCAARGRGSPPVPRATRTMSRASIQPLPARRDDEARVAGAAEAVGAQRVEGAVGDVVVDREVGVAGEGDDALDAGPPRLDALPRAVDGREVAARGVAEDFGDGVHGVHQTRRVPPGARSGSTCWHRCPAPAG